MIDLFFETSLADSLKAAGRRRQLTLCTLTTPQFLNTVSLHLSVQGLNDVLVVDKIPAKPNAVPDSQVLNKYRHLANLELPRIKKKSVQLLIGANIPKAFRVEDVRTAPNTCSPDAVRSPLGWSLLGPSFIDNSFATNVGAYFVAARYESLPTKYVSSFEAQFLSENNENFSYKNDDPDHALEEICATKGLSVEDRKVFKTLKKSVKLNEGHYELPLP